MQVPRLRGVDKERSIVPVTIDDAWKELESYCEQRAKPFTKAAAMVRAIEEGRISTLEAIALVRKLLEADSPKAPTGPGHTGCIDKAAHERQMAMLEHRLETMTGERDQLQQGADADAEHRRRIERRLEEATHETERLTERLAERTHELEELRSQGPIAITGTIAPEDVDRFAEDLLEAIVMGARKLKEIKDPAGRAASARSPHSQPEKGSQESPPARPAGSSIPATTSKAKPKRSYAHPRGKEPATGITKRCTACNETKDLNQFYRQAKSEHGRAPYCKPCWNDRYPRKSKETAA